MASEEPAVSLSELAYRRLRQDILTCTLAPGRVVSERELAHRYEMSKTPIREAFTQTCHAGLTQRLPGRGYMVAPITIKDIQDIFDLRMILEVTAAERAAQHSSAAQITVLRKMSNVRYALDNPSSHALFLKTNRTFHLTLAKAAANRRLVDTLEMLFNDMERLFYLGLRLRDSSEEMAKEHQEVVAALAAGDVEGIRNAIARQILTSRDRIMEAIMQGDLQHVQVSA